MRRQLRERLRARVTRTLEPRAHEWAGLQQALGDLEQAAGSLAAGLARAETLAAELTEQLAARHRRFTPEMTVHAAWALHPGVRGIFTARHLPACPDCAVGADETLAEAAFGYALELDRLLAQLNSLLGDDAASPGP